MPKCKASREQNQPETIAHNRVGLQSWLFWNVNSEVRVFHFLLQCCLFKPKSGNMIEVWLGFNNLIRYLKLQYHVLNHRVLHLFQAYCYVVRQFLLLWLILKSFKKDIKSGTVGNSAIKHKATRKACLLNRIWASEALVEFQRFARVCSRVILELLANVKI